jgi:hypothetical protein
MRHDVKHFSGEREKQTMSDVPAHTWFFPVRDEIGLNHGSQKTRFKTEMEGRQLPRRGIGHEY